VNQADRHLTWFLRFIGYVALLAFLAAVMPADWKIRIGRELGIHPFPDAPLTFYLARNLSLLYGYVGAALLLIAADLERYRPLIRWAALGTLSFGVLQLVVDAMSGMPSWWTFGEGGSTFAGGLLLGWLDRRARNAGNQ